MTEIHANNGPAGHTRVAAIYTATALVDSCNELFAERMPDVELINIIDDRLIFDINRAGRIDSDLEARTLLYFDAAERAGVDAVFCTCSSIGEIADIAAGRLRVPVVRIDEAMVSQAVRQAERIGVLATLASTLDPTARFIEREASEEDRSISIVRGLATGAYEAAMAGDVAEHDDRIAATARQLLDDDVELFVLAQGSMARMERRLADETGKPVLSSLSSGIDQVAAVLGRR